MSDLAVQFKKTNTKHLDVAVIGDPMLDQYVHCDVAGISPEDDLAWKLRVVSSEYRAGGAANVAMGLKALGANVYLIGVTGSDSGSARLQALLRESGVHAYFSRNTCDRRTTCKTRYLSRRGRQICRIDDETKIDASVYDVKYITDSVWAREYDAIVVSDYCKGTISRQVVDMLNRRKKMFFVDPKSSSLRFYGPNAFMFTPNAKEVRLLGGVSDKASLDVAIKRIPSLNHSAWILAKNGPAGASLWEGVNHRSLDGPYWKQRHYFAVRERTVGDPAGCGDSLLAALIFASACGWDIPLACRLGVAAGACAYDQVGVKVVTRSELLAELGTFAY